VEQHEDADESAWSVEFNDRGRLTVFASLR
jgi:hypothetical protein